MADGNVFLDVLAHFETIHYRHHHIADYDVGTFAVGEFQPLLAILGREDILEILFENRTHETTEFDIVLNEQYRISGAEFFQLFVTG